MSVRMKLTRSKTGGRRAHHKKSAPELVATKTGVRRRHFVDPQTGMYRGKQILSTDTPQKAPTAKKETKSKKEEASGSSAQADDAKK